MYSLLKIGFYTIWDDPLTWTGYFSCYIGFFLLSILLLTMTSSSKKLFGPPNLKPVYRLEFTISPPHITPANGPYGTTCMINVLGGTFKGYEGFEDFHGEVVTPSTDLLRVHDDGSGITLNPTFVMKLHDGNKFLSIIKGKSERDPDNPDNSRIHSGAWFEVGDERFRWLNGQVLVGYGIKQGQNIKLDYYQICV